MKTLFGTTRHAVARAGGAIDLPEENAGRMPLMKKMLTIMAGAAVLLAAQGAQAQYFGPGLMAPPGFFPQGQGFGPPMFGPPVFGPGSGPFVPPPVFMPAPPPPPVFMPPPPPPVYYPQQGGWGELAGAVGFNREAQVAADCVAQFGPNKAAAACIATRLTVNEIAKCFNDGIGGRGCFGDNNMLVQILRSNLDAAMRETDPASAWFRLGTGISVEAIRDRGVLGGDTSEARKACDMVAGVFGREC